MVDYKKLSSTAKKTVTSTSSNPFEKTFRESNPLPAGSDPNRPNTSFDSKVGGGGSRRSTPTPTKSIVEPTKPVNKTYGNTNFTGTYTAASEEQSKAMKPINQFGQSFYKGFTMAPNKTGEDFQSFAPLRQIGYGLGFISNLASLNGLANIATKTSAVAKSTQLGTVGLYEGGTYSTATNFATNSKNIAQTSSWLTKLAQHTTNPQSVATGLMAAIGSYPFSGFIKEESLQTLGFGVRSALGIGDKELAQEAINNVNEILDPNVEKGIYEKIPFVNVLSSLKDFYNAARLKNVIDQKLVDTYDLNLTPTQNAEKIKIEEDNSYKANIDYYNEERKKLLEWERQAALEARNEDAKFWADQAAKQRKMEEEDREAQAKFWEEYKKRAQEIADNNSPSKLNFGLL